jgi:hypothetical protein
MRDREEEEKRTGASEGASERDGGLKEEEEGERRWAHVASCEVICSRRMRSSPSPTLLGSLTLPSDPAEPFSHSAGYVPTLHRGAPSHLINVLIAVNDSEIPLARPKVENVRERGHDSGERERKSGGNIVFNVW